MQKIGMFEAKTHLPELIRSVQNGEEFCLTNRKKEVAVLLPIKRYDHMQKGRGFDRLKEVVARAPLGSICEIMAMKEEGRR